jgi:4a-hydroxytetrahydrobiopterin dehydratase
MTDLSSKRCGPCTRDTPRVERAEAERLLSGLGGWELSPDGASIERRFELADYYETLALVNAVAFIAHREDHHPDMEVRHKTCTVRYTTHAIGGLSENDFICAAKVDRLLA